MWHENVFLTDEQAVYYQLCSRACQVCKAAHAFLARFEISILFLCTQQGLVLSVYISAFSQWIHIIRLARLLAALHADTGACSTAIDIDMRAGQ